MGESYLADLPGTHSHMNKIDTVAAGDATEDQVIFTAPFRCVLTGVTITPNASSTGDNTNTKNLNVIDKAADGSGAVEVGNLDLVLATDLTEADETTIPLTGTAAQLAMLKGDVLMLEIEQVGTGVAIGESLIKVQFRPSEAGV